MRNLSANKANPNKPLELFVQGEGIVVEWPRNIMIYHYDVFAWNFTKLRNSEALIFFSLYLVCFPKTVNQLRSV